MEQPLVLAKVVDHIAIMTLNHPEKRNALSAMLALCWGELARTAGDRQYRVVILRANGPVFSSGHDLRELVNGAEEHGRFALHSLHQVVMKPS